MHKNTNKQNQYLLIHFEYPSPQARTKQLMISFISTSGPLPMLVCPDKLIRSNLKQRPKFHSVGHKIYTITVLMMPIIRHNVEVIM